VRRALLLVPLALAGCGAGHRTHAPSRAFTVASYGRGPARVWLFRPEAPPRAIVVFIHGHGDVRETTPYYHRPWLEHLARERVAVVYPRYELYPGQEGALAHIERGVRAAAARLPDDVPVVAIGYSRGGRLVCEWASQARRTTGLMPKRILSVFPSGAMDQIHNLSPLTGRTKVVILAGDRDEVVGTIGAGQLVTQLAASQFPYHDVRFEVVRSHGAFVATHLSVLESSPGARRAFWARADRMIDAVAPR
jgi:predicted alpha/beta-hydrolase family hydrolase